jgi:hypothetical protein
MHSNSEDGITVSASSTYSQYYTASKAVDGQDASSINNTGSWTGRRDSDGDAWYKVDLGSTTTVFQYDPSPTEVILIVSP